VGNYCWQVWGCTNIRAIASALLLVALVLTSCTQQNTAVKVGTPSTSADADVNTNTPSTLAPSKLFLFTRNDKSGYIDRTGEVVIPLKFGDVAEKFSNGLAWVSINGRYGYIDKTGKVKIPVKFTFDINPTRPRYFEDGPFVVIGDTVLDVNFDRGLAAVKIPKTCRSSDRDNCDRIGYIDTTGKLVFEF
jgi:hypothetical protein